MENNKNTFSIPKVEDHEIRIIKLESESKFNTEEIEDVKDEIRNIKDEFRDKHKEIYEARKEDRQMIAKMMDKQNQVVDNLQLNFYELKESNAKLTQSHERLAASQEMLTQIFQMQKKRDEDQDALMQRQDEKLNNIVDNIYNLKLENQKNSLGNTLRERPILSGLILTIIVIILVALFGDDPSVQKVVNMIVDSTIK